eukprot:9354974-Pyramimonas_sp.AAC.2
MNPPFTLDPSWVDSTFLVKDDVLKLVPGAGVPRRRRCKTRENSKRARNIIYTYIADNSFLLARSLHELSRSSRRETRHLYATCPHSNLTTICIGLAKGDPHVDTYWIAGLKIASSNQVRLAHAFPARIKRMTD